MGTLKLDRRKKNQKGKEDEEEKIEKGKEGRRWPIMNRKGKRRKGNKGRWNSSTAGSWGSDVLTCRIPSPVLSKGERMKSEASVSLRKAFVLCKAGKLLQFLRVTLEDVLGLF